MISYEQARQIALEQVKRRQENWRKSVPGDDLVLHTAVEFAEGWLFYFTSEKFLRTRNNLDRPIGGGPIIVGKENGDFLLTGSGGTQEEYVNEFINSLGNKRL